MPNPDNLRPPWKPGESGNPDGRPKSAGASLREWINLLQDETEEEWRAVANNPTERGIKRAAAIRLLRTVERGDLADMEGVLNGEATLGDVRAMGINTEVVKKLKVKTRTISGGDGPDVVEVEREMELHDRSGDDFDRVFDRTEGRPKQSVTHDGNIGIRTTAEGATEGDALLAEVRARLGVDAARVAEDPDAP